MGQAAIPLSDPLSAGRRCESRLRLGFPALLLLTGGGQPCRLMDLSRGGAALDCGMSLRPGTTGFLRCEDMEVFGEVVWTGRYVCGFRFDDPLGEGQLLKMRRIAPVVLARRDTSARDYARSWVTGRY